MCAPPQHDLFHISQSQFLCLSIFLFHLTYFSLLSCFTLSHCLSHTHTHKHTHKHCHTMGAGHARSRYLNRKEGGAEGRASDWSEVVTR